MRKKDINKYLNENDSKKNIGAMIASKSAGAFFSSIGKMLFTMLLILIVSGFIVGVSVVVYFFQLLSQPTGIDLNATKMQLTSVIYVNDEEGNPVEYQKLYSIEDRTWVEFDQIPKNMKNAIIAIEDKRFYDHQGVDLTRTVGAVISLLSGSDSYGGSTLTQQLIKNITGENDISINRKLEEIFRAINLEREYTKDIILEAYLNIVNFGSGASGVQSAAQLYFGKDIGDCTIAQCAAIAGITQNPAAYTPLEYPENNKERREIVINEMYDQEMISKAEYEEAMEESANMEFVGYVEDEEDEEDDSSEVPNWYIDMLYYDVVEDLAREYNISEETASLRMYTEGFNIYSAMDLEMQEYAEDYVQSLDTPSDPNLQIALMMMEPNGRIIASVGGRNERDAMLLWDRANMSTLQPGSSIKPVISYPMAVENDYYHYSSLVNDEPFENWAYSNTYGWQEGPQNVQRTYYGQILLPLAIEKSLNASTARTLELVGVKNAYDQAVNKMGFRNLTTQDSENLGGLSIGGLNGGVTVREMVSSYQYLGNGGRYYDSYSYYYVTDQKGNVILDNRETIPIQAYSEDTATVMNRLLNYNVNNSVSTNAGSTRISGWDIIGKTGTTDDGKDHWFVGLSPYAVCGVWVGYDTPSKIYGSAYVSEATFKNLMTEYLEDKEHKEYPLSPTVTEHYFCTHTGLLATESCPSTQLGYYKESNTPEYCYGYHGGWDTTPPEDVTQAPTIYEEPTSGDTQGEEPTTAQTTPETQAPTDPVTEVTDPIVPETTDPVV